jgi:DUF4097 and DUF4098 domain-containing protein YvlB
MNEERARILKMLEDGKITAEEAARLLEALKERPRDTEGMHFHGPRFRKRFPMGLEMIPEVVARTVEQAVESGIGEKMHLRERKFSAKSEVGIRAVSSDIEIHGWEKEEIFMESSGLGKVTEDNNRLDIKTISGDVKLNLPIKTRLVLTTVSGDIEIEKIQSEFEIRTVSGDVELENIEGVAAINTISGDVEGKDLTGNFMVKSKSGDIDLSFRASDQGEFETANGDISITLPKDVNLILELESEEGDIELDIPEPYDKIEEREGYLKIGLGDKKGKFICQTASGDIEIKK